MDITGRPISQLPPLFFENSENDISVARGNMKKTKGQLGRNAKKTKDHLRRNMKKT